MPTTYFTGKIVLNQFDSQ